MKLRKRLVNNSKIELRNAMDDESSKLIGYGIVYGQRTKIYSDLYEIIHPGAASDYLATNPDIRCALNHSMDHIFGRSKSGTASFVEDEFGVRYEVEPPDTQWSKDAMESIKRGDIDGSSFTFYVSEGNEKVTRQKDGSFLREIFKLDVIGEMGPVSYPAYEGTSAYARSLKDEYDSFAEHQRALEESAKIADRQRALGLRKRRLELVEKTL